MPRTNVPVRSEPLESMQRETPPPQQNIEWLTAKEAAEHLRIRTRTLLLWTRQGKIRGYALSGGQRHVWRFLRAELDADVLGRPALSPQSYRSSFVTKRAL